MTRFAFAGKCGCRGASGLAPETACAPEVSASVSRPAKAILPRPTPHSCRKWRRVTCWQVFWIEFMVSAPGNRFVKIPQRAGEGGPCGAFVHLARAVAGQRPGVEFAVREPLFLSSEKFNQQHDLVFGGGASEAAAENPADAV